MEKEVDARSVWSGEVKHHYIIGFELTGNFWYFTG